MAKIELEIKSVKENETGSAKIIELEEGGMTTVKTVPYLEYNEATKAYDGEVRPDRHFEIIEKNWGVPYEELETLEGGTIEMFESEDGTLSFNEQIPTGFLEDENGEQFVCTIVKTLAIPTKIIVQVESDDFEGKRGINLNFTEYVDGQSKITRKKRKTTLTKVANWVGMSADDDVQELAEALIGKTANVAIDEAPNGSFFGTIKKVK